MAAVAPKTSPRALRRLSTHGDPESLNALIGGDNLEVLERLLPEASERFRLVYVDPPYNTGRSFKE